MTHPHQHHQHWTQQNKPIMTNQYDNTLEENIHQQLDETGVVRDTAHGEAYSLSERISALALWRRSFVDQNCELRAQVKTLSAQLEAMHRDNERLGYAVTALRACKTQPEPSRLQVAAMIFAAWEANPEIERLRQSNSVRADCFDYVGAVEEADSLIARSREVPIHGA